MVRVKDLFLKGEHLYIFFRILKRHFCIPFFGNWVMVTVKRLIFLAKIITGLFCYHILCM